jgi:polyisoprenoid-binding protein YceI
MPRPDAVIPGARSVINAAPPGSFTPAGTLPTGRWAIDAARSTLRVSVRVGMLATAHGTFADVSGHVDVTSDPVDSTVAVTVGTASLSSGSACMDSLLHGAGLVDSAKNPCIGFVSRSVRASTPQTWLLDGRLATDSAVLDVTLDMMTPVAHDGAFLFRASGRLPSEQAVRLLSHPGVERVLGRTMALDLTVVAIRA